jgi:hypothetical protein
LYRVLAMRSFVVTDDVRDRIDHEIEVSRLDAWTDAAVRGSTLGDVFRDR